MKVTKSQRARKLGAAATAVMLTATLGLAGCAASPTVTNSADKTTATAETAEAEAEDTEPAQAAAETENDATTEPAQAAEVDQNRVDAKQVIMGATNLFASMDLGLTDADSPATISQSDAQYAEFFEALLAYRNVEGLDVSDTTFDVTITAVEAATARGVETNYRFTIDKAAMTVNGVSAEYTKDGGLTVK